MASPPLSWPYGDSPLPQGEIPLWLIFSWSAHHPSRMTRDQGPGPYLGEVLGGPKVDFTEVVQAEMEQGSQSVLEGSLPQGTRLHCSP